MKFEEGMTVDDALKKISEESGFRANFCVAPDGEQKKPYIIPHTLIYKGVTPEEAFRKILKASGGSMLHLPIKEQAKNISVCSRGEVFQGCTVFYLGKGLYERYQINGEPPTTMLESTVQSGTEVNNDNPYASTSFSANKYKINTVIESKSKKALEKVNKVTFQGLFESCDTRCQGPLSDGVGWKGTGPSVENKQYTKTNFYGIAPTGTKAISYLSGKVQSASKDEGKVVIKTDFWFQICKDDESEKCFGRYIFQESNNLSDVKVGIADTLKINQEIGSSTGDKKELIRFYINGHDNKQITIDPQLVWKFANPTEAIREISTTNSPSSSSQPQPVQGGIVVGRVGSTGNSTGPHLHAESVPRTAVSESQLDGLISKYVQFSGKSRGRGFGGHGYPGIDYPAPEGTPLYIIGGASVSGVETSGCTNGDTRCGGGFGNSVLIKTPEGITIRLAHLQGQSIPPNLPGLSSSSSGSKTSPTAATGPTTTALTIDTAFKGVPRALRITPGRTILSFVTEYDKWIDNDGHKGRDNSTDPGVWIPERFRNWFVKEVDFQWRQGDLRVSIEANNAWGATTITAPTFYEYVQAQTTTGEFKITKDYYGYIRSAGPLCFPLYDEKTGKYEDSCAKNCKEAQDLVNAISSSSGGGGGDGNAGSQTGFPAASCEYKGTTYDQTKVNKIIKAAYAGGIRTNIGLAGVVANAIWESRLDPKARGDNGKAWGIFQWNSRRPELIAYANSVGGSPDNFDVQMGFFVKELKGSESATVPAVNGASTLAEATIQFEDKFERAGTPKIKERIEIANQIFPDFVCAR
jgi:hypothetical protein